ncbi:MAG: hypothetical protein MN733_30915 [Nitrososphaera sp.]|nr:hypothetical protein [Nitrososphaera sp.]
MYREEVRKGKMVWAISLAILFTLIFCAGFVFFYTRRQQDLAPQVQVGIGRQLPPASLIDSFNQSLTDTELRNGKAILVFLAPECDACLRDSVFLKEVVGVRTDVPFYGIISFGDKDSSLRAAEGKFPFRVFYDQGQKLSMSLGIKRVPIKLFVENGIIKRAWSGATINQEKQTEFVNWLKGL